MSCIFLKKSKCCVCVFVSSDIPVVFYILTARTEFFIFFVFCFEFKRGNFFMVEIVKITAESMKCLCDLSKAESQSYKATGYEASTVELSCLVRLLFKL